MHARIVAAALLLLSSSPAEAREEAVLSEIQAGEEVRFVVSRLRELHPDPFHATPEAAFDREVRSLR